MSITPILFDIDGTLLNTHGAGRRAFSSALKATTGIEDDLLHIRFAGATDLDLLQALMSHHQISFSKELAAQFFEHLHKDLKKTVQEEPVEIFKGVSELLDTLNAHPLVRLALVTGNTEMGAQIKLEAAGLDHHFRIGAFGREHADRCKLAAMALDRLQSGIHSDEEIDRVFLIGDTPSDISAAHSIEAECIAVATGGYNVDELQKAGADYVLYDLSDTDCVLALMGLHE